MKVTSLPINGLKLIQPQIFSDERGYFFESFNQHGWRQQIENVNFVQDNESYSHYGVLRGLHMQIGEYMQAKLVRVISGKVYDVVVDLRANSPSFKQHFAIELSAENKLQLYVPRGFAHGFLTTSDHAILQYKCDNYYYPAAERGVNYADSELAINWPLSNNEIIINERDRQLPELKYW
jgi:dTDP-4-dehydrorhamnose 3,5-epimerase